MFQNSFFHIIIYYMVLNIIVVNVVFSEGCEHYMNEEESETIKKMLDEIDEHIERVSECVAYLKDKYGLF